MGFLTADDKFLDQLRRLVEPIEIRDPSGKVLGHYMPLVPPEVAAMYEKAPSLFDIEEAKQAAASEHGKGRPLKEILPSLRSLERQG